MFKQTDDRTQPMNRILSLWQLIKDREKNSLIIVITLIPRLYLQWTKPRSGPMRLPCPIFCTKKSLRFTTDLELKPCTGESVRTGLTPSVSPCFPLKFAPSWSRSSWSTVRSWFSTVDIGKGWSELTQVKRWQRHFTGAKATLCHVHRI